MWIISDDRVSKILSPDHTYSFGRAEDNDFILRSQAASRYQFLVKTGAVKKHDIFNSLLKTPLELEIKTRAKTIVNHDVLRLSKGDLEPITKDLTLLQHIQIDVVRTGYKSEDSNQSSNKSTITFTIFWYELNILTFTGLMKVNGEDTTAHLTDELKELYNLGIDIRIEKDPLKASHYYTVYDKPNLNLKIALLRAIPIIGSKWLQYVKNNINDVTSWLLDLQIKDFLPIAKESPDCSYLLPSEKRKTLFQDVIIAFFNGSPKKIKTWTELAGAKFMVIDDKKEFDKDELLESIRSMGSNRDIVFIDGHKSSEFSRAIEKAFSVKVLEENDLFIALITCSVESVSSFKMEIQPRRKRRKYERIKKTELLEFGGSQSPEATQSLGPDVLTHPKNSDNQKEEVVMKKEVPDTNSEQIDAQNNDERNKNAQNTSIEQSNTQKDKEEDEDKEEIREVDVDAGFRKESSEPRKRNLAPTASSDKTDNKKIKLDMSLPSHVSFADAVKEAKTKATETMNNKLGIEEVNDGLADNLKDLAVVEMVKVQVRTYQPPSKSNEGRKNFKNFKKVQPARRSNYNYKLKEVTSENGYRYDVKEGEAEYEELEDSMERNFRDEMDNVKGYKDPLYCKHLNNIGALQDQLFVPEDESQELMGKSHESNTALIKEGSNFAKPNDNDFFNESEKGSEYSKFQTRHFDDDDDDDDDSDEEPKFGFSRG